MAIFTLKRAEGKININEDVFARIVIKEAEKMKGSILLCNKNGKQSNLFRGNTADIVITAANGNVNVEAYALVRFGISMFSALDKFIENIERGFSEYMGIKPASIKVYIMGTRLKSKTVPRNIVAVKIRGDKRPLIINNGIRQFGEACEQYVFGIDINRSTPNAKAQSNALNDAGKAAMTDADKEIEITIDKDTE